MPLLTETQVSRLLTNLKKPCSSDITGLIIWKYQLEFLKTLKAFISISKTELEFSYYLKIFLKTIWQDINNDFNYQALISTDIFEFLNEVLIFAVKQLNKEKPHKKVGILNLLMPSIHTESSSKDWPNLGTYIDIDGTNQVSDINLKEALQRYILSDNKAYLIPIAYLPKLLETAPNQRFNPYFDYQKHPTEAALISDNELTRLINHCDATKALCKAYQEYQSYLLDEQHLLGRLHRLCTDFYVNSSHNEGSEMHAAAGVYTAIINFNEYYKRLNSQDLAKIPKAIKENIENLIKLTSDPDKNEEGTENAETCVYLLREDLKALIEEHQATLNKILTVDKHKKKLLLQSKHTYEQQKAIFLKGLKKGQYNAKKTVKVSFHLLSKLKLQPKFKDVDAISLLEPEEIAELSRFPNFSQEIAAQFSTVDDLAYFLCDNKPSVLKAIFNAIWDNIELSAEEFSILFGFLNTPEKKKVLLEVLKIKERDISYLIDVIHLSSPSDIKFIYQEIKDDFPGLSLFEYCNNKTQQLLYDLMEPSLKNKDLDLTHINFLFQNITKSRQIRLFKLFEDKFLEWINSIKEFKLCYESLKEEIRNSLYRLLQNKLTTLIHTRIDFTQLSILPITHLVDIYLNLPEDFFKKLDLNDWIKILKCLKKAPGSIKQNHLEQYIFPLVDSAPTYEMVAQFLSQEQQQLLFNNKKELLLSFLKKAHFFSMLLPYIPPEQRVHFFRQSKKKFLNLLNTIKNLTLILQTATVNECKEMAKEINYFSCQLFSKMDDILYILLHLSENQRKNFVKTFYHYLDTYMENIEEALPLLESFFETSSGKETLQYYYFKDLLRIITNELPSQDKNNLQLCKDLKFKAKAFFKHKTLSYNQFALETQQNLDRLVKNLQKEKSVLTSFNDWLYFVTTYIDSSMAIPYDTTNSQFNPRFFKRGVDLQVEKLRFVIESAEKFPI
ncbi:MAG: hypothetical protein LCH30_00740 [Proteobacteria bacterium]|nr:hypothetical protein [Pseudomonadota bacterium]